MSGPTGRMDLYHMAFAVPDLDSAMGELGPALGLRWRPLQEGACPMVDALGARQEIQVRVTYSEQGNPAVELVEARPGTPLAAPEGSPFHHLGYWVDDLAAASRRLEVAGWSNGGGGVGPQGEPAGFAFYRHPGGLAVELLDVHLPRPWLADLYPPGSPHHRDQPDLLGGSPSFASPTDPG